MKKNLQYFLQKMSMENLMNLSRETESPVIPENSKIREIINNYFDTDSQFQVSLLFLKLAILQEVTARYFNYE